MPSKQSNIQFPTTGKESSSSGSKAEAEPKPQPLAARPIAESIQSLKDLCPISSTPDQPESAVSAAEARDLYVKAGVPLRHRKVREDALHGSEWKAASAKVVGDLGSGFIIALVGGRGTGKTQIAQRAILANSQAGRWSLYTRAMTFFIDVKATYGGKKAVETEDEVISRYAGRSLLVIDEVQVRGSSKWEDQMLTHLIDNRYGSMWDTILIANLTPAAFAESVGPSINDRIRETGGLIECTWPSFRDGVDVV